MRALLLVLLASAAHAQPWGATLSTLGEAVSERDDVWTETRLAAGGQTARLGGVAEAGVVGRFGQRAAFVGADLYPALGRGVYANVRARWAPGSDVTARLDAGVEAFAALGSGVEASAGVRRLAFADRDVTLGSVGAGLYAGPWYLRGQLSGVPRSGRPALSGRVLARRFLGDGAGGAFGEFWEVSAGRGEEARLEAAGASAFRTSWSVGGRVQRRLAGGLGGALGAGYVADGDLSRAQAEAGVFVRW